MLKRLWYDTFHDFPLSGVAEQDGELLYYQVNKDSPTYSGCFDIAPLRKEGAKLASELGFTHNGRFVPYADCPLHELPDQVRAALDKVDINSDELEFDTEHYSLSLDCNVLWVEGRLQYDLYRMIEAERNWRLEQHASFQQQVGYHTDLDPSVYQPYVASERSQHYQQQQPTPSFPRTFVRTCYAEEMEQ